MMIGSGTAFLLVLFYLITLIATGVTNRPWYKWMWRVAATVLGVSICIGALIYVVGLAAVLLAI